MIHVPSSHHGRRIDQVLADLFPDYSRSKLSSWLKEGVITVNQQRYKPKDKVCGGEQIVLNQTLICQTELLEPEDIPLNIVFEDDDVLVVNKPSGLIVHPGAGNPQHTLVHALLHHDATLHHLPRAGIVHRLDKDTTGLLVIAKTLTAHTSLIRQMHERTIQRYYLTLVYGHVISGGAIETGYGRDPRNRLKMAVLPQGKEAITHYSVKKQYQLCTLLQVKLMTGRTHQIRVHMTHLHHPVIGDPLYRGRWRSPVSVPDFIREQMTQFKRQALHACELSFLHPRLQTEIVCKASLPDDFHSLLTTLDTYLESSDC